MRESELQEQTRQMLAALKRTGEISNFFHGYDMRRTNPGYPDWTIIIRTDPGRLPVLRRDANDEAVLADGLGDIPLTVWIELKTANGVLSRSQERWKECLGDRFYVARSLDEFADVLRTYGVQVILC